MIKWFNDKKDPEQAAREAIQQKKWARAISFYEKKLSGDRDFALWNLIGDLHMNNRAREQAVDAWRRALEGYATEGLHENVLGIARKILRRAPDEEDVHLLLAEACLEMEYHADSLAAARNYIRAARRVSAPEMKALIKKMVNSSLHHPHLLEELRALYHDSGLEDVELEAKVEEYIRLRLEHAQQVAETSAAVEEKSDEPEFTRHSAPSKLSDDGLQLLDVTSSELDAQIQKSPEFHPAGAPSADFQSDYSADYDGIETDGGQMTAPGDGKDHYDLGNVYREMRLWDAAVAEFEQARRDPSLRIRSSLALAECLQETNNLQGALDLLEAESQAKAASPQERMSLHFQLGVVNELLGNLNDALTHFQTVYQQNTQHAEAEERIQSLRRRMGATA